VTGSGAVPAASVLIPVYNEERWIRETAAAARAQRLEGGLEFIFIDGRSEDRTREILEELAAEDDRIRVLDNPARQIPQALNVGLAAARGRWVARMDAHSWYPDDYVALGVGRLERGDVEWVSGPAVPRPTGHWGRRVALALGTPLGQGGSAKWREDVAGEGEEYDLDTGVFAGVWPRATLERLGGWDDGWPVNEDSEMASRHFDMGGRIVCLPAMAAEYAPRDDLRALTRQYFRYGLYRAKTARRHPKSMRISFAGAAALTLTAGAALVPVRWLPMRAARGTMGAYAVGLGALTARASRRGGELADLAGVPVVLAVMHLAFGAGFVVGCGRFGVPGEGLRALAGRVAN
jgi:glycosyltransferase involved in cell wall biosynthesis